MNKLKELTFYALRIIGTQFPAQENKFSQQKNKFSQQGI